MKLIEILLGKGSKGSVYSHNDPSLVLKTFYEDPAYEYYLNWCIKHPNNRFGVKVKNWRKSENQNEVLLERLEPVTWDDLESEVSKWNKMINGDPLNDDFMHFSNAEWERLSKVKDLDIAEFAKFITGALASNNEFEIELQKSNIMKRGSQIVFIDPLF